MHLFWRVLTCKGLWFCDKFFILSNTFNAASSPLLIISFFLSKEITV